MKNIINFSCGWKSGVLLVASGLLFGCGPSAEVEEQKEKAEIMIDAEAFEQARVEAEKGDAEAQNKIGVAYALGQGGVTLDYEEAMKWYRLAADQGWPKAQNNLGVMYRDGQGVDQDYEKAIKWFLTAADQGFAGSQYNLGVMYYNALGVPQDLEEVHKWLGKAADQGHEKAEKSLVQVKGGKHNH